jgi:Flp pilus assembly protein TadD
LGPSFGNGNGYEQSPYSVGYQAAQTEAQSDYHSDLSYYPYCGCPQHSWEYKNGYQQGYDTSRTQQKQEQQQTQSSEINIRGSNNVVGVSQEQSSGLVSQANSPTVAMDTQTQTMITDILTTVRGKSLALSHLHDNNAALSYANLALSQRPNDYVALNDKAIVLFYLGDLTQALQILDHALALNQHNPSIYYNKGVVLQHLGDFVGAIDNYNKALKIAPNDKDAAYNRARAIESLEAEII